jgi:hypothetical protein
LFHVERFGAVTPGFTQGFPRRVFHVEHSLCFAQFGWEKSPRRRALRGSPVLTVEADEENNAKDDRGEKDLGDAIVKDSLIGLRGVEEVGFFLG